MSTNHPVRGQCYTIKEVMAFGLDSSLLFRDENDAEQCVQTGHLSDEEAAALPGWDRLQWRYSRTTSEWVSLFYLVGKYEDIKDLLAIHDGHYDSRLFVPAGTMDKAIIAWPVAAYA